MTVTVLGYLTVIKPLVSFGVSVAAIQFEPLLVDISQVDVKFQLPETLLLKYSLAENAVPLNVKYIRQDKVNKFSVFFILILLSGNIYVFEYF